MRRALLSFFFLFVFTTSFSQVYDTLFFQGFDSPDFPPSNMDTAILGAGPGWQLYYYNEWDGTYGYAEHGCNYYDQYSGETGNDWLITSGITVPDTTTELSFWQSASCNYGQPDNLNAVLVLDSPDPRTANVLDTLYKGFADGYGQTYTFSLANYVGSTVYIAFNYKAASDGNSWDVDNILVTHLYDKELRIAAVQPLYVSVGSDLHPSVMIQNEGTQVADNFKVVYSLYKNGDLLTKDSVAVTGANLGYGQYKLVDFVNISFKDLDLGEYTAKVQLYYDGDAYLADNQKSVTVRIISPYVEDGKVYYYLFYQFFDDSIWPPENMQDFHLAKGLGWHLYYNDDYWHPTGYAYHDCQYYDPDLGDMMQNDWLVTRAITVPDTLTWLHYVQWGECFDNGVYYQYNAVMVLDGPDPRTAHVIDTLYDRMGTYDPEGIDLSLAKYAGQTIFIGFNYQANNEGNEWDLDSIFVYHPYRHDLKVADISPRNMLEGTNLWPKVKISNLGIETYDNFAVHLVISKEGEVVKEATVQVQNASLVYGQDTDIVFSDVNLGSLAGGKYNIECYVDADVDDYKIDDTLTKPIDIIKPEYKAGVLYAYEGNKESNWGSLYASSLLELNPLTGEIDKVSPSSVWYHFIKYNGQYILGVGKQGYILKKPKDLNNFPYALYLLNGDGTSYFLDSIYINGILTGLTWNKKDKYWIVSSLNAEFYGQTEDIVIWKNYFYKLTLDDYLIPKLSLMDSIIGDVHDLTKDLAITAIAYNNHGKFYALGSYNFEAEGEDFPVNYYQDSMKLLDIDLNVMSFNVLGQINNYSLMPDLEYDNVNSVLYCALKQYTTTELMRVDTTNASLDVIKIFNPLESFDFITLVPKPQVIFTVTDEDGNPLEGAQISIGEIHRMITTDDHGKAYLLLDNGLYHAVVGMLGYSTQNIEFTVDNKPLNITVKLKASNAIADVESIGAGKIKVFPNPARDYIYIQGGQGYRIELLDLQGQLIKEAENRDRLSLEGLANGVYILRLSNKDNVLNFRVIKQ